MFGGAIIFFATIFPADVSITGSYAFYFLVLCKFLTGFVGCSISTAKLIVQSIYKSPKEQIKKITTMMPLPLFGVATGSLFGGTIITVTSLLLSPAWVAMILSLIGGFLVLIFVPTIPKREKKENKYKKSDDIENPNNETTEEKKFDKTTYNQIMLASFFDQLGTGGLKGAIGLILLVRYKDFVNVPTYYSMANSMLIFFIILGMFLGIHSLKNRGPAYNAWFGNLATMVGQILLVIVWDWRLYFAILYISFACSFYSTVSYMPMLIQITSQSQRAKMQATTGAMHKACGFILPICIGVVADYGSPNAALIICACFSFFGFILSLPLRKHPDLGPPIKKIMMTEDEVKYLKNNPNYIEEAELENINDERSEKGEGPLSLKWGTWENDKKYTLLLRKVAYTDFLKSKNHLKSMLKKIRDGGSEAANIMRNKASASWKELKDSHNKGNLKGYSNEMGQWIADYLMDSGHAYTTDPVLQKVIIMSAFPKKSIPTKDDGKPFKDQLIEVIHWIDHAVDLEVQHPDNELTTLHKKMRMLDDF